MPSERDLIADFTRIRMSGKITHLEVASITWPTPDQARIDWQPYHTWTIRPSAQRVYLTRQQAVRDKSQFPTCKSCGDRNHRAHMHKVASAFLCHPCSESQLKLLD